MLVVCNRERWNGPIGPLGDPSHCSWPKSKIALREFAPPDIRWIFDLVFLDCVTVQAVSGRRMLAALFLTIKRVLFDYNFLYYTQQQASLPSIKFRTGSWELRSLAGAYKTLENGLAGERIIKSYSGQVPENIFVLMV